MAATNGKLYLIGDDRPAMPVVVFDPAMQYWTEKSIAPDAMHHFQPVALGKQIFVQEAFTSGSFPNQSPLTEVYIYDTENDRWKTGAGIADDRKRAGAGAAA